MAIVISGSGIDMGGNPVSNASQIDSTVINENGENVATDVELTNAITANVNTAGIALKTIATGTATFDAVTNSVTFSGLSIEEIENFAQVEIGDVLQYSNATDTKNNSEFTIEVLTQKWANGVAITAGQQRKSVATNITYTALTSGTTSGTDVTNDIGVGWEVATSETIIVNQAHVNKGTTKNVATRASDTGVSVKLLAKWYNAPTGLGQDLVNVISSRIAGSTYPNNTNRSLKASIIISLQKNSSGTFSLNGSSVVTVSSFDGSIVGTELKPIYTDIAIKDTYSISSLSTGASISSWWELR